MASGKGSGVDALLDSDEESPNKKQREGHKDEWRSLLIKDVLSTAFKSDQQLPDDVRKHVKKESEILAAKVSKSLNLIRKISKLDEQIDGLKKGEVHAGIKPWRCNIDVPELDQLVPENLASFDFKVEAGTTIRALKEKFHFHAIAVSKVIDRHVMALQVETLKQEITKDSFVAKASQKVVAKASDLDSLMQTLSLNPFGAQESEVKLSVERAEKIYLDIMNKIAIKQKLDTEKAQSQQNSLAKQIDRLKDTKPEDMLKLTVEKSVVSTLKAHGVISKKNAKSSIPENVNFGLAYTKTIQGFESIDEAVEPPSHQKQPFQKAGRGKGKSKEHEQWKERWKGPVASPKSGSKKDKGKGKGHQDSKGKGKSQGDKGPAKGKGKGKGKSKSKSALKGRSKGKHA